MRARLVGSILGAVCFTSMAASATTMVGMNLSELALRAGAIVHGHITDIRSDWNETRTHIFTFATLQADDYLKGDLGPTITVLSWGGRVGPFHEVIPGTPEFKAGEEVVLFLSVQAPQYPAVLGLSQGKFSIATDPQTGLKTLTRNLYGASLTGLSDSAVAPVTLSAFRTRLEALIGRTTGRGPNLQR
jgi:hypothetical protein